MISHILQVSTFSAAHFCRPLGSKFSSRKRTPKEEDSFFSPFFPSLIYGKCRYVEVSQIGVG